jgi:hypothetical protein
MSDWWRRWKETGLEPAEAFLVASLTLIVIWCVPMLYLILTERW